MPTFTLDDREIPFEPGDTIITAAHRQGIDIPHYCWHPGLSVAANCRMCLVEVGPPPGRRAMMLSVLRWDAEKGDYVAEEKPKLQPACQLGAREGMVIKSQTSEHVLQARASVQEMLLLNHPVDCPICDQAGECKLQDYWLEHHGGSKQMKDDIIHMPKAVRFGETIVYDAERCIVCTRCVRFMDEVAKDPVLDKRERGNLGEIVLAPGRELEGQYTLMTEYVCPVGALTAVDFRFKARVWFLRSVRSVCQGCATGCNAYLDYDPRNETVYRHRPRDNMQVNKYWMCDEGMLDYRRVHENRVLRSFVDGQPEDVRTSLIAAADLIKAAPRDELAILLSAEHSNEDNFALATLAKKHLGVSRFYVSGKPAGEGDDILRSGDKNPNAAGAKAQAGADAPGTLKDLATAIGKGDVTHLVVLGSSADDEEAGAAVAGLKSKVVAATHQGPLAKDAKVLLAASSWAESDGTFVNKDGLEQLSEKAVRTQGESHPAWKIFAAIGRQLGFDMAWTRFEHVEDAMAPANDTGSVGKDGAATGAPAGAAE